MDLSQGSIWRKWDLHIHTPASYHWNGKKFFDMDDKEKKESLKIILEKMETIDIAAFGIMDYWTFDGYCEIRKFNGIHKISSKPIFPGMELRIEAPVDYRLNIHVLLSDELSDEALNVFKNRLEIRLGTGTIPLSRGSLIQFAKTLDTSKAKHHGFSPIKELTDEDLFKLGSMTAEITRESLKAATEIIGKDKSLIILPYDTSDGLEDLDWRKHPLDDNYFMQSAHFFETRSLDMVDLFLGKFTSKNQDCISNFQKTMGKEQKPVLSGSDAHEINKYGVFPNHRATWLKTECTFRGLLQVFNQPSRSYIGELPEQLKRLQKNRTKFIKSIGIRKAQDSTTNEIWFDCNLPLNPGLIAIIGNKGNGKSALTDIIALLGDSHRTDMNFLNKFKRSRDKKANCFEAEIIWEDGTSRIKKLSENVPETSNELVKYIPQNFFERVCNETPDDVTDAFEEELQSVIFSHIAQFDRLSCDSLKELLNYRTKEIRLNIEQFRAQVRTINEKITDYEKELSKINRTYLQNKIDEFNKEISSIDSLINNVVDKPLSTDSNSKEIEILKEKISKLDDQINECESNLKKESKFKEKSDQLIEHVRGFNNTYQSFVAETKDDFDLLGITLEAIVSVKIDDTQLQQKAKAFEKRKLNFLKDLDWKEPTSLSTLRSNFQMQLDDLTSKLDNEQRNYQQRLQEIEECKSRKDSIIGDNETQDTLKYYLAKVESLKTTIPQKLAQEKKRRATIARDIYRSIRQLVTVYEELYSPVQFFIDNHKVVKGKYELKFKVLVQQRDFCKKFLSHIDQGARGPYYGKEQGRMHVQELLDEHDFNDEVSTFRFIGKMLSELRGVIRTFTTAEAIESLTKGDSKVNEVYDTLFTLEYLDPTYLLKLGDKDLSLLSPGERGVVLLIFYLLVDNDDCPLIIDQPEENLDSQSIYEMLVKCVKEAKNNRQIILVTLNPNLAVVCDADQIIYTEIDKVEGNKVQYKSGAIEEFIINAKIVEVLEGTWPAFLARQAAYFTI